MSPLHSVLFELNHKDGLHFEDQRDFDEPPFGDGHEVRCLPAFAGDAHTRWLCNNLYHLPGLFIIYSQDRFEGTSIYV